MRKNEKAILIAEDILARIEKGSLHLRTANGLIDMNGKFPREGSFQDQIDLAERNCKVCAIGGMFLSYVSIFGKVKCFEFGKPTWHELARVLDKVFSRDTLVFIEYVFEGCMVRTQWDVEYDLDEFRFFRSYMRNLWNQLEIQKIKRGRKKAEFIMSEICRNIIRNDGQFVAEVK